MPDAPHEIKRLKNGQVVGCSPIPYQKRLFAKAWPDPILGSVQNFSFLMIGTPCAAICPRYARRAGVQGRKSSRRIAGQPGFPANRHSAYKRPSFAKAPEGILLRAEARCKSCEALSAKQDGAVEKTRTFTGCPTATSTLRVYQFRHDRTQGIAGSKGPRF